MPMEVFDAPPTDVAKPATTEKAADEKKPEGWLERTTNRGIERGKEIAGFPVRLGRLMSGADKPQNVEDYFLLAMANAPLIAAGGAGTGALAASAPGMLARAAPVAGRIATTAGLSKARGESNAQAAVDAAGAGVAEGAGAIGSKLLGATSRAVDAIRQRIGTGQSGPVNLRLFDALMDWWKADPNKAVQAQRASRVASQLRTLDPSGESSKLFKDEVVKGAKIPIIHKTLPPVPPGVSRVAEAAATNPIARGAADAVAGEKPGSTVAAAAPLGLAALVPHGMRPRALDSIVDGE